MAIEYPKNDVSSGLNKVVIALVATAAVSSPFSYQTNYTHNDFYQKNLSENFQKDYLSIHDWESSLLGAKSTGGEWIFQREFNNYYKLCSFAQKFLSETETIPLEFEKTFLENFWDILA